MDIASRIPSRISFRRNGHPDAVRSITGPHDADSRGLYHLAGQRFRVDDLSRHPRTYRTSLPQQFSDHSFKDGLLRPGRVPLRHHYHGTGGYRPQFTAERDTRGKHGYRYRTSLSHWILLLDYPFNRYCLWARRSASSHCCRLDDQCPLHEFRTISHAENTILIESVANTEVSVTSG